MPVKIHLLGALRDLLPAEKHGRSGLEIADGETIRGIAGRLGLPAGTVCSVNGQVERDLDRVVMSGDELTFFRRGAGG